MIISDMRNYLIKLMSNKSIIICSREFLFHQFYYYLLLLEIFSREKCQKRIGNHVKFYVEGKGQ